MFTRRHSLALLASALSPSAFAQGRPRRTLKRALIIVSLADNANQGIVPIKESLGRGDDPKGNLYWGALYGMKTYFNRHADYDIEIEERPKIVGALQTIRITPKSHPEAEIIAVAMNGNAQTKSVTTFFNHLADPDSKYDLVSYVGHNPLMDVHIPVEVMGLYTQGQPRKAAIIGCQSEAYFKSLLEHVGAEPYVLTQGNMAPEAYVLDGILTAWLNDGDASAARLGAAEKYAEFQKIPLKNTKWLFDAS